MATATRKHDKRNALKMYKGVLGRGAVTHYSCGVVEKAKEENMGLIIVDQSGSKEIIVAPKQVRMVHRPNFVGTYSDAHESAGKGKYIRENAWKGKDVVVDVRSIMPYLPGERCNYTIVETFYHDIGRSNLSSLQAHVKNTSEDGSYLHWDGPRNAADCVVASPWRTRDQLWEMARKVNSRLTSRLKAVESHKRGVKEHLPPKQKFFTNINVMRRTRRVHFPASGETEFAGGITPYAMPLEQAGFAIDMCFLTDSFHVETSAKGVKTVKETGDYYFRLVIGRSIPWVMYKADWLGLDESSHFAYKSEEIRQRVIAARKRYEQQN